MTARPAAAALLLALLVALPGDTAAAGGPDPGSSAVGLAPVTPRTAAEAPHPASVMPHPASVSPGPTAETPRPTAVATRPAPVAPRPAVMATRPASVAPRLSSVAAPGARRAAARQQVDLPVPEHDPGEVRETARRVLRRPEFLPAQRSPVETAWDWLMERLGILLGLLASSGAGSIVGLVVVLLIMAAVFLLIVRFSRGITRDPAMAAALPAVPRRSGAEWRAEAEAHERAGDWRQAVRSRYRALVADLAARGLVDEIPGRTAGEYRGEVRQNVPTAAAEFADATELFELAWYARWPSGPDDAARLRTLSDQVLSRVPA